MIDRDTRVSMLPWPQRQGDREDLARQGVPRLLLVAADSPPPVCTETLEDWVRLPVDALDLRFRLQALAQRQRARTPPTVDSYGILRQDHTLVFLAPAEQRLASALVEHFGEVVPLQTIREHGRDETEPSLTSLRVHTTRLRQRIASLGLRISCIKGVGYIMHRDDNLPIT
jgi:DNA-binding response OmpR family regulator